MKLKSFVLGVRVNKSFSIEDKLGSFVDEVLNHENGAFSADFFPKIQTAYDEKKLLHNVKNNSLSMSPNGFILNYNVEENFEEELKYYSEAFEEIVLKDIIGKNKIRNINRLGVVLISEVETEYDFLNDMISVVGSHHDDPKSFSIRFNTTKNVPIKVDNVVTKDYLNQILTFDRPSDDQNFLFSVDYQKHYVPALNIYKDIKNTTEKSFTNYCQTCLSQFKQKYFDNGSKEKEERAKSA